MKEIQYFAINQKFFSGHPVRVSFAIIPTDFLEIKFILSFKIIILVIQISINGIL